jgi:hypothetical protein
MGSRTETGGVPPTYESWDEEVHSRPTGRENEADEELNAPGTSNEQK